MDMKQLKAPLLPSLAGAKKKPLQKKRPKALAKLMMTPALMMRTTAGQPGRKGGSDPFEKCKTRIQGVFL